MPQRAAQGTAQGRFRAAPWAGRPHIHGVVGTAWSSGFWNTLTGGNTAAGAPDFFRVNPGDLLYQWNQLPGAGVLHPL